MYIDDAIRGTLELMEAPSSSLTVRTSYNFSSLSFSPEELYAKIKKLYPNFRIEYEPDFHQAIADTWPKSIDASVAATDWAWKPKFSLSSLVEVMAKELEIKLTK